MDTKTLLTPKTAEQAQLVRRLDGWSNLFTGIGTARDKRTYSEVATTAKIPYEVLSDLYRSNALAARICDRPAEEMTREGWECRFQDEKDVGETVDDWLKGLNSAAQVRQCLAWRRAYGGAAALIGVNKGNVTPEELAAPLSEFIAAGRLESVDHLTVFNARELQTVAYYSDPLKPSFGEPAIYKIVPQVPFGISGQAVQNFGSTMLNEVQAGPPTHPWSILPEVHESWLLKFDGVIANRRQRLENWGWGDSVLQRVYEVLRDFDMTWASAANLIQDFAQGILTIPGLIEYLATEDGTATLQKRVEMLDTMRSVARSVVLDGGDTATGAGKEEFHREVASLTSVPEVLAQFATLLASAADMPVTLLMGVQSKGLGNGGEADQRWWYDHVKDMQVFQVEPQLRYLINVGMQAKQGPTQGASYEGKPWSIYFNPLWQLDEVQQAAVRKSIADTDALNIQNGIYTPEEARASHYGGDGFSLEVQLDEETREAFDATDPKEGEGSEALQVDPQALAAGEMPEGGEKPEGGAGAPAAAGADLQALALNGAQITGMLAILQAVRDGALPPESGILALVASFPFTFTFEKASALVKPIEVKEPPPPPDPLELAKAKAAGAPATFGGKPPATPVPGPGKAQKDGAGQP